MSMSKLENFSSVHPFSLTCAFKQRGASLCLQVLIRSRSPLKAPTETCRCGLGEDQQPLSVFVCEARLQSDFSHLNSAAESLITLSVRWI